MRGFVVFLGCVLFPYTMASAADFQGADAVLERFMAARATPQKINAPSNPVSELWRDIFEFRKRSPELAPDQSAVQWLALFDRFMAMPREALGSGNSFRHQMQQPPTAATFFEALPPTAAWDAIANSFDERARRDSKVHSAAFGVLAAALRGDPAAQKKALVPLQTAVARDERLGNEAEVIQNRMDRMAIRIERLNGNDEAQVQAFDRQLGEMEKRPEQARRTYQNLSVPDLANMVGRERSEVFIRRIFSLGVDFRVERRSTRRLFAAFATENIGLLKEPRWDLVEDLSSAPLYEPMLKRFPGNTVDDRKNRSQADMVRLAALIAQNRLKDAGAFLGEMPASFFKNDSGFWSRILNELVENDHGKEVLAFLRESLTRNPSLSFWDSHGDLSASLGETKRAVEFLHETAARRDLKFEARKEVEEHLVKELLAADQLDEGIALLRKMIKAGSTAEGWRNEFDDDEEKKRFPAPVGVNPLSLSPELGDDRGLKALEQGNRCLRLGDLGALIHRPDLVDEAIAGVREAGKLPGAGQLGPNPFGRVIKLMLSQGRATDAEAFIARELELAWNNPEEAKQLFFELATIYDQSGRYDDAMRLLDGVDQWMVSDVGDWDPAYYTDSSICGVAANALAKTGKTQQARKAVRRIIEAELDHDPAYALLLELGGDDLDAFLEACAKRDRAQWRPVMWKAKLQLDAGRVREAEKTIRVAIAIDPSDRREGEWDGTRYSLLAEVLDKKGDPEGAKGARVAAEAISQSGKAEDFWQAGLSTRAVRIQEEAVSRYLDSYSMQWQLALWSEQLGDIESAARHYQRCFELMPGNSGHFMGCNRCGLQVIFEGKQAQEIAERVFSRLAKDKPENPSICFCLGMLREEQGQRVEAAAQFLRAARLDPDFFSAWIELLRVAEAGKIRPEILDEAILALLRLDPGNLHHQTGIFKGENPDNLGNVSNPRVVWDGILSAEKERPRYSKSRIYPLAASAAVVESAVRSRLESDDVSSESADEELETGASLNHLENLRHEFMQPSLFYDLIPFIMDTQGR